MRNYIYVLVAQNGLFKIGETTNLGKRIAQVKSASPCVVESFFYFEGAQEKETQLHHIFAKKRVRGEWFALDGDDLRNLIEGANEELPAFNRKYILELIDEMDKWGFFELGKQELTKHTTMAALMRCSVAMNDSRPWRWA